MLLGFLLVGNASSIVLSAQDISLVELPKASEQMQAPQIKKETSSFFKVSGDASLLLKRSISEYNIHGKLVQFTEYETNAEGVETMKVKKIQKYDRKGRRVGTMIFNSDNALVWSEEYRLDEKGRKSRTIQMDYENVSKILYIDYEYDASGALSSITTLNAFEEVVGEDKRSYNSSNGELLSVSSWSYIWSPEEKRLLRRSIRSDYKYDNRGNMLRSETEITEGKNKWKDIRNFENSFVIEWLRYKNNELVDHFKHNKKEQRPDIPEEDLELPPPIPYQAPAFEYDDDKRDPLENISHNPYRSVSIKNNAQGLPVKEVLREAQQIVSVTYFFYDENGRLQRKKKTYKQENWTDETHYEYDAHFNPIRELTYRDGVLIQKCSFEYEYYP